MRASGAAIALLLALTGCASQEVRYRQLPPDMPAANNAVNLEKALALAAEAASAAKSASLETAAEFAPITPADAPPLATYDPWAGFNRSMYRLNARFDEAVFLPVANYYRMLPSPIRAGVHNFFGNLAEIDSIINYTLQGRLGRMVRSVGRFAINSTLGLGGLFDVAQKLNLPRAPTGFGTTLAKWGMHPGPYLVIPIYGPSTLREGVGLAADYGTSYAINVANLYRDGQSWGLGVLNAVDQRANVDFRYYASGSPFEYDTIRFLYVRKLLIEDAGLHPKEPLKKVNPEAPAGQ
ncbi:MAG: VacJ family lipoprotein [Steroidobacteraceae bacterium]